MDEKFNKIVDFYEFCGLCQYEKEPENSKICDECLSNPINYGTKKPIKWVEKSTKK